MRTAVEKFKRLEIRIIVFGNSHEPPKKYTFKNIFICTHFIRFISNSIITKRRKKISKVIACFFLKRIYIYIYIRNSFREIQFYSLIILRESTNVSLSLSVIFDLRFDLYFSFNILLLFFLNLLIITNIEVKFLGGLHFSAIYRK